MTLNQLKALFASIGSAHYFIKTTEFGTVPEKIEANTEASYYPAFYQVIDSTTTLVNTVERTFTLIVCDLVYPDLSNLDEVHSDTEQTLNDIIKILRQESDYYTLLDAQLTPFKDRYGDAVAGWEATVVIETLYNSGFCDIPSDIYGYPGITGPNGLPIPPAFDCDSLSDCSVIQGIQDTLVELQDEIDNLELYTFDNGLTLTAGNVQLGGPLIQNTSITGSNLYNFEFDDLVGFVINNSGQMSINTIDSGGTRQALSEHYVLSGFTGQSWLSKNGIIENQLIHTTVQFAVTYDSFARIPFSVDRNNPNGEGILKTLPTYVYTTNADALNGIVGVNSTGELFNTGITAATLTGFVPYTGATTNVTLGNFNISATTGTFINGIINAGAAATGLYIETDNSGNQFPFVINSQSGANSDIFLQGVNNSRYILRNNTTTQRWFFGNNVIDDSVYISSSSNPASAQLNIYLNGNINMGNAATTNQRITRIGQDSGIVDIGSLVGNTSYGAIYLGTTGLNSGANNYSVASNGGSTFFNCASGNNLILQEGGNTFFLASRSALSFQALATTAGTTIPYVFTVPASTGQTASTNVPNFKITGNTKQFATGTLASQYFNHLTANTLSFVGVSTASEVFGTYIEAAIAGTNATFTNNFALGLLTGTSTIKLGNLTGTTTESAIYMNAATPSTINFTLRTNTTDTYLSAQGSISSNLHFQISGNERFTVNGANSNLSRYIFTPASTTSNTASTERQSLEYLGANTQLSTGALATQRFLHFKSQTLSFVGASTATNVYNGYFETTTAGTNATITNNYALGTNGATRFDIGAGAVIFDSLPGLGAAFHPGLFILPTATAKSGTNWSIWTDSQNTYFNAPSTRIELRVGNVQIAQWGLNSFVFSPVAINGGAVSPFTFTRPNSTLLTASTEVPSALWATGTVQHATGTITTNRDNYWRGTIHAFVGASTLTNLYTGFFEAGAAGANATITRNFALGTSGALHINTGSSGISTYFSSPGAGITSVFESSTTNYQYIIQPDAVNGGIIWGAPADTFGAKIIWGGTLNQLQIGTESSGGTILFTAGAGVTSATLSTTSLTLAAGVGMTAGNAITIQRLLDSSVTNLSINSGTANTNAFQINTDQPNTKVYLDARNGYSLSLQISDVEKLLLSSTTLTFVDAYNMAFNTTTGTKLGTATNQKIGMYNATPVIQYATTGTLTGFTANTSVNAVFNESTFTGNTGASAYTISDIVRALKLLGIMAA